MKRTLSALVGLALIAGGVGVLNSSSSPSANGDLKPTRVVQSSGNDTSAPLSTLESAGSGSEADREQAQKGQAQRDENNGAGDAVTYNLERVRENARRPIKGNGVHQPDGSLQRSKISASAPSMPAPISSFDGVNSTQSGCGCYPPDTNAEVGPNHIVETVNTAIAVYNKVGIVAAGFPKPVNALWAGFNAGPQCRDNNNGDPVVMYDGIADRWVVTQFAIPGFIGGVGSNYECIAVSATNDPTGSYHRYQFTYTNGLLNDYPKFGVWPDGYYATYNNFTSPTGNWAGPGVASYDRTKMLAGLAASVVQFNLPVSTNEGGLLPSDLDGTTLPTAGAPNPIIEMQDSIAGFAQDQIMIRRFHVDFATPGNSTLSAPTILATTAFDSDLCSFSRNCIAQKNTGVKLDTISDRIMFRASYRNFSGHDSLLINSTVDATGTDVAGVRWAEVRGATGVTPSIVQQSTYSPDNTNRWMGSIAQDKDGNIALGYSASSSTVFPSLRYAGRLASDPLGQLSQGEAVLFAGTGSQTGSAGRWGDYSDLSLDPTDDCTFWYASEYYATTSAVGWRTRIGSFKFPSCGTTSLPTLSIADASILEGNTATKNVNVKITLSQASATPVTVKFATANGTATAGSDYTAKTATRTIAAGITSITIQVTIIGDTTIEPNERFKINLSNPTGATIADGQSFVTISNDD